MVFAQGWGKDSGQMLFNEDTVSAWEDEQVLAMDGGDGYTTV